ncbi:MAG: FAD-dependent thymidylate synthase [Caldilineaceae bacterium]|nr:FAD-dependent thymidylate synthase [Caldilineaceae bacterium]
MKIKLLAYTQPNPDLTPDVAAGRSDLATIAQGHGPFPEQMIEYAGRVCYRSTHRMGTAPEFIAARVREGHEDIIEHVVITLHVIGTGDPLRWRMLNRHCEVSQLTDEEWVVSGNTRVWLDFFRQGIALEAIPLLIGIAPKVFDEFVDAQNPPTAPDVTPSPLTRAWQAPMAASLLPAEDPPMRVTLLGFTQPQLSDPRLALHHGSATFFFEGVSRTCTHQLVRHRLASFSQESQRYVDLSKGGWEAVVPKAIAANPEAMAVMEAFWQDAEEKYAQLRKLGIRKEDARFLLPNAAETRIVTTMNFAAWSHFLWLRAVDKAAQWEIRAMGQRVLEMLYAVAPEVFQEQWDVYQEKFVEAE